VLLIGSLLPCQGADLTLKNSEDRQKIIRALPASAPVKPQKTRKLLVFTRNVGYGGHPSIAYANEALRLIGEKTGAFETVVTDDPAIFSRDSLWGFDGVFFNNTVGNCFTNAELRHNLMAFLTGGGGLMGVHGSTVAFTQWPGAVEDWPEFGLAIGARGANHKDSDEHVWIRLEDADHPITRAFQGKGFDYRDEFFRVHDPYSRNRVRVLLSIDTEKTDVKAGQPRGDCYRADGDYAVAWIRNYGRGRVFYCTIAHNPYVFWDSRMLEFYLAAVQFILGDLRASAIPSARLTPELRLYENLGFRLCLGAERNPGFTLPNLVDRASRMKLSFAASSVQQRMDENQPDQFGPRLSDSKLEQTRMMLDGAGVRLLSCDLPVLPRNETDRRDLFEFGRKLGIETLIAEANWEQTDSLERLCESYNMRVAFRPALSSVAPPEEFVSQTLKLLEKRNRLLGICLAVDNSNAAELTRAVEKAGNQLQAIRISTTHPPSADQLETLLKQVQRLGVADLTFQLQDDATGSAGTAAAERVSALFYKTCLKLTK
jgi:type 1 glutamine amidotransferase